jgi:hypothetical protein
VAVLLMLSGGDRSCCYTHAAEVSRSGMDTLVPRAGPSPSDRRNSRSGG